VLANHGQNPWKVQVWLSSNLDIFNSLEGSSSFEFLVLVKNGASKIGVL